MKKKIWIYPLLLIVLVLILVNGCKKDDKDVTPDNLAGTNWKSFDTDYEDEEYYILKFTSKTIAELWIKDEGDPELYEEMDGIYSISGNNITIDFGYDQIMGVIEGKNMSFADDGSVIVFTKQ